MKPSDSAPSCRLAALRSSLKIRVWVSPLRSAPIGRVGVELEASHSYRVAGMEKIETRTTSTEDWVNGSTRPAVDYDKRSENLQLAWGREELGDQPGEWFWRRMGQQEAGYLARILATDATMWDRERGRGRTERAGRMKEGQADSHRKVEWAGSGMLATTAGSRSLWRSSATSMEECKW